MLVPKYQTILFPVPDCYSIHSFCSLFYDRSSAHFKVSFQQNAIYFSLFNFQYSVFPLGHPIAAYTFFLFFPSLISFNNMFHNSVPTKDVTNPVILPAVYCVWNIHFLLDAMLYFFISHMISPTDLLHPSLAPPLQTSQVFLIYFPISLICDKSVTNQNLAFLSYWYRKKRSQMHF